MTDARVSRTALETLVNQAGADLAARVSRIGLEALVTQTGTDIEARISRVAMEVLVISPPSQAGSSKRRGLVRRG